MSARLDTEAPGAHHVAARESDHRIANSLAVIAGLVRLEANTAEKGEALSPREARAMLDGVATRIDAVARLHRLLAHAPKDGHVNVAGYLRDVTELAFAAFDTERRMQVVYQLHDTCETAAGHASALGLIVHEAVVNALKYAHPSGVRGELRIACTPIGKSGLIVTVEDDGIGLPEDFDPLVDGGVGLRIIRALAEQIDASLNFRSSALGCAVQVLVGP